MKVLLDHRSGNLNSDTQFDIHDKDGLVDILHKLNGTSHTMLSIERDDNHRLDVGGGSDLFVVICTTESEKNLTLLNPKDLNSEDLVELCAGGQYAEFPKKIVVDKEVVTKAVPKNTEQRRSEIVQALLTVMADQGKSCSRNHCSNGREGVHYSVSANLQCDVLV